MVLIYTQTFSLANKSITPPEPQLLAAALRISKFYNDIVKNS